MSEMEDELANSTSASGILPGACVALDYQDLFDPIQLKSAGADTATTRARRQVLGMSMVQLRRTNVLQRISFAVVALLLAAVAACGACSFSCIR